MKIFPGESLHSFIIRTLLRNGLLQSYQDLTGIIKNSGSWLRIPTLQQKQRTVFAVYPVQTLLDYVESHTPLSISKRFSDPRIIPTLYQRIFLDSPDDDSIFIDPLIFEQEHLKVRYCPYCFCHQLQNDGVTWFKFSWMRKRAYCKTHGVELVDITSKTCRCTLSSLDRLQSIMTGQCSRCSRPSWPVAEKRIIRPFPYSGTSTPGKVYTEKTMHTAPCVMWSLYSSLRELKNARNSAIASALPRNLSMQLAYMGAEIHFPPNLTTDNEHHLVKDMKDEAARAFDQFFDAKSEVIFINIRLAGIDSLLVPMVVLRSRDCKTCRVAQTRCPLCIRYPPAKLKIRFYSG